MLLQSRLLLSDHDGYKLYKKKKVIIAFQQKGRHGLRELSSNCAVPPFDSVSATNPARAGRLLSRKITQKRSRESEEMTVRPGVSHGVEVAEEKKKRGGGNSYSDGQKNRFVQKERCYWRK